MLKDGVTVTSSRFFNCIGTNAYISLTQRKTEEITNKQKSGQNENYRNGQIA